MNDKSEIEQLKQIIAEQREVIELLEMDIHLLQLRLQKEKEGKRCPTLKRSSPT